MRLGRHDREDSRFYNSDGTPKMWSDEVDRVWAAMPSIESQNKKKDGVDLEIEGVISEYWVSSAYVGRVLSNAGENATVNMLINSPGGSVHEAMAIRARLARHKGTVNAYIMGLAASAGQFISMAADNIYAYEGSQIMIHRAQGFFGAIGDYEQIDADYRPFMKALKDAQGNLERGIAKRMGIPQSRVATLLKNETWYTESEATDAGLVDSVLEVQEDKSADKDDAPASKTEGAEAKAESPSLVSLKAKYLAGAMLVR